MACAHLAEIAVDYRDIHLAPMNISASVFVAVCDDDVDDVDVGSY